MELIIGIIVVAWLLNKWVYGGLNKSTKSMENYLRKTTGNDSIKLKRFGLFDFFSNNRNKDGSPDKRFKENK
mgnify:CR=1 FL=1